MRNHAPHLDQKYTNLPDIFSMQYQYNNLAMDPAPVARERLVRDYSNDGASSPVNNRHLASPIPSRDRYLSPARSNKTESVRAESSRADSYKADSVERPASREQEDGAHGLNFELEPVEEKSDYEPSISTQPTSISSRSRLADFFGAEVFQIVLHNPTTAHQLKKFAQERLCGENLEFLEKVRLLANLQR